MFILGYVIGRMSRKREQATHEYEYEDTAFHDLTPFEAGGFVFTLLVVALVVLGAFGYLLAAYVSANGAAESIVTALWLLIGFPLLAFGLHHLGKWAQRHF